jgi:alkylation response protein AidB-like acyl-CoA dehydrogenase
MATNDHARILPPRVGSTEMKQLIAAIGESAAASKRAGKALHDAIDLVRQSRLGAIRVPVADGGGGCSVREYFAMLMDLAAADPDVAHLLRAHYWVTEERMRARHPSNRIPWIEKIVGGDIFGNAVTELGGNAAVGSWVFNTKITPRGERFVLNGTKYYVTGSLYSDWIMVFACDPSGKVVSVIIPSNREGVTLEDDWDGIGQRLTGSGTAVFRDVEVLPDEVQTAGIESTENASLADPADPLLVGQFIQLILTAVVAGIVRSVAADAAQLVKDRGRTYSHAPALTASSDPVLQQIVGELESAAFAAESIVLAAADAQDIALASMVDGAANFELVHRASLQAAQAKVVIDELAARAATRLFDVGGASAVKQSANLDRHWRNIRTVASHNPTVYKACAIGNYLINGATLPGNGFF